MGSSLAEADLQAVIIEFGSELVVCLWLQVLKLVSLSSTAKHLWQVLVLRIDLELVQGAAVLALTIVVWVSVGMSLLQFFVDAVVHSANVTVDKSVLGLAVAEKQVALGANLAVLELFVVFFVLLMILTHKLIRRYSYLPKCLAGLELACPHLRQTSCFQECAWPAVH